MYPKLPMKFRLSTRSAPFLSIGPGGFSLQPVVDVQAYAILPDATLAPLFLLSLVSWAQPAALQLLARSRSSAVLKQQLELCTLLLLRLVMLSHCCKLCHKRGCSRSKTSLAVACLQQENTQADQCRV